MGLRGFLAERDGGNTEDLVEFFATNDTASKLKERRLAFLKEALMSKNHPREDYEELLHLPTCSSVVKVQPNHSAVRELSINPGWMAKAIYSLKLQMLKSSCR
ncbi:hypothetical protein GWK47_043131 [Chionoecetes opilio]|uniref:Uncharacterized protein n=1 Tax=Chionoecetes opilio TaxID=41210 RepID=A0A8J4YHQ6_CHIOP|nr:hypothetical protein GWK47_043131 [Chionoecetes opilio]